jgi:hypothetical protein
MSCHAIKPVIVVSTLALAQLLLGTQLASAQTTTQDGKYTLAGQCSDVLATFVANGTSAATPLGNTGPITYALESGQTSTVTWDFTAKTETWNLFLTANSAAGDLAFHITETGALPSFNLSNTGSLTWSGTNSGTVDGAATTGTNSGTFTNPGTAGIPSGDPAINVNLLNNAVLTGSTSINAGALGNIPYSNTLTIDAGAQTLLKGGTFTVTPNAAAVPEANSLAIAALGATGMGLLIRRRRQ